ncbi:MAG: hypothetical protein E7368_02890 [Clostridiales bacterium]|nr:hypothetical protein [Clostridiales bacterium]
MYKIISIDIKQVFADDDKKRGVQKYAEILQMFPNVNVKTDKVFQKKFNGFYRVRRNADWQKVYYSIMEKSKGKDVAFADVLWEIYNATGRVEASFASKLVHTLNNDMPIWDKFVLQNLDKKMPILQGEKKLLKAIEIYDEIIAWYKEALLQKEVQKKILEFDAVFPQYSWFSNTKKIDFLLWQNR